MSTFIRVFDGAHLRATLCDPDRDKLIVTFAFRRRGRQDFGEDAKVKRFAAAGYAQLRISPARNDWFINPETAALEETLAEIATDFTSVRLFGYSMGGYGALRFARALRADWALIVSPQFSIDPKAVPFDRRYIKESMGYDADLGDLRQHRHAGLRGMILVDPTRALDLTHAQMIAPTCPKMHMVRLGFGGHPASQLLRRQRAGAILQDALLQDAPDPRPLIAAHRALRRQDAQYWLDLARSAIDKHPTWADAALARAESFD